VRNRLDGSIEAMICGEEAAVESLREFSNNR
jgi:acylphosphatase